MLAKVGEGTAGESEDVRSVRVQRDGALGFVERVIPGRSNVRHQRKVGAEGAEQRQQRTRQCEV